ncbi:MAG: hypothetical protein ACE5H0_10785 [Bacteroidota bacterium]
MTRLLEELEELKNEFHRRLLKLIAMTHKLSPERAGAEELKNLWDQISALEATLDVFGDAELAQDVEAGLSDIAAGRTVTLEEVRKKYLSPEGRPEKGSV